MSNATATSKRQAVPVSPRRRPVGKKPEEAERREPFLTGIQERIADILGELIVTGGTRRNLDALCRIAADHEARRVYVRMMKGEHITELEKRVSDRAANYAALWYDELAAARAKHAQLPEAIRPEPKATTDLILSRTREELKGYWAEFLAEAMPAELFFMANVFLTWDSIHSNHEATGFEAFYIANAFEDQILRGREYVRVPAHLTEDVENYLKALLKASPVKEAA